MIDDQGRRSGDIDPAVQLYVQDALTDTRHALRNDIQALGTKVELFSAQSTKEHAEVKAALAQLIAANLEPRVAALERKDAEESAAAAAVDRLRRQQRWFATFLVAAVPVALIAAPHIH